MKEPQHPIQPLIQDEEGRLRFKQNKAVRFLLDELPGGLGTVVEKNFPPEDVEQLCQLIGYSHNGAGTLITDEVNGAALIMHLKGVSEFEARNEALRETVNTLVAMAEGAMSKTSGGF